MAVPDDGFDVPVLAPDVHDHGMRGHSGPATLKATRRFDGLQVGANALLLPGMFVSRRSPDPSGAIVHRSDALGAR
jgi:hypothetical protein